MVGTRRRDGRAQGAGGRGINRLHILGLARVLPRFHFHNKLLILRFHPDAGRPVPINCPGCKVAAPVAYVIVHLNDAHRGGEGNAF